MHHIYHTTALVIGHRDRGESNRSYRLFTRELGMVVATAQGVRKLSSKLRYALQEGSVMKVDLVRGKEIWRVTSGQPAAPAPAVPALRFFRARVSALVARLVGGEEANHALFDTLLHGLAAADQANAEDLPALELVLFIRVLHALGYWEVGSADEAMLLAGRYDQPLYTLVRSRRQTLADRINNALNASQL